MSQYHCTVATNYAQHKDLNAVKQKVDQKNVTLSYIIYIILVIHDQTYVFPIKLGNTELARLSDKIQQILEIYC